MADTLHNSLTNHATDGSLHTLHLPGYSVANVAAMGNITTGSMGDLCFVQSSGSYYAYSGTVWQALSSGTTSSSGGNTVPAIDAAATASVGSGDLFAGTTLDGGWTSLQSTALTSNDRTSANWLVNKQTGNTSGQSRGLQRAFSPSADFTVYAKLGGIYPLITNYQWAGIFVGAADPSDGASGHRLELFLLSGNGQRLKFAKNDAGSETVVFSNVIGSLENASVNSLWFPAWLRIKRVSTTLTASISWDGVIWIDQSTTTTISWSVATIGVFQAENSSTAGLQVSYNYIATTG